jgi:hypothetical protein
MFGVFIKPSAVSTQRPLGVAPILWDFVVPSLPAPLTFTRGSKQIIRDGAGTLVPLNDNTYGVHHAPNLTPLGYLSEGPATNSVLQSNTLNTAPWSKTNVTVVENSVTGPDGLESASTVAETESNSVHAIAQDLSRESTVPDLVSAYVKFIGGTTTGFCIRSNSGNTRYIDMTNGAWVPGGTFDAYWIESVGNGWYRLTVRETLATANTPITWRWRGAVLSGSPVVASPSYPGVPANRFALWGAAHVRGASYPTSPIITGAALETRAACKMSGSFAPRTPSAIRLKGRAAMGIGATDQHLCALTNFDAGNHIRVYRRASDRHLIVDWVSSSADLGELADDSDFDETVAVSDSGYVHLINVGHDKDGARQWDGTVARVEVR